MEIVYAFSGGTTRAFAMRPQSQMLLYESTAKASFSKAKNLLWDCTSARVPLAW
jgi:hypothetical protein